MYYHTNAMQRTQPKRKLVLIVEPTPRCIKLLRFIRSHLPDIREMDMNIVVKRAPKDAQGIKALAARGISSTPAMVGTEGSVYIGEKRIYSILNANLKKVTDSRAAARRIQGGRAPPQDLNDLHSYWMAGMYSGQSKNGRPLPRDDGEETDDLSTQIVDRTRKFESRRTAPPSDDDDREEDNVGDMGSWGARRPAPAPKPQKSMDPPRLPPRQKKAPSGNPAEMDDVMINAWMDNNLGSE